jgi:hypothetical protein
MSAQGQVSEVFGLAAAAAANYRFRLVNRDGNGHAALATAGGAFVGVVIDGESPESTAVGARLAVRDRKSPGIYFVTAAKTIAAGALLYAAADGKVSDTAVGPVIGRAFQAAAADGGIIAAMLRPDVGFYHVSGPGATAQVDFNIGYDVPLAAIAGVLVRSNAGLVRHAPTITKPSANVVRVAHADLVSTDLVSLIIAAA